MARIGEGQEIPSNEFKKAIYAIRGNNRQTKGMACAVAIEGQNEGSVLLVTDTWNDPEPITGCLLHRYSRIAQHFKDYQLKPVNISQRGDFSLVMCDGKDSSFEIKSLHKKCLSGQELERDFRVYTIYREKCIDLELKYNNGGYNLIDNDLPDLTLCGSPIIDGDNFEKYLVGILTTNDEGKAIPCFLSNGILEQPAFTTHPEDCQTRREGENITFASDANGIPEPKFTWTKNESAVTVNDRISLLAANKQLKITNVNTRDSGKYRCVATNRFGTVYSDAATLTVHYKPKFTEHPESQTRREGSSVDFLSDAHGVPEPKFSWIKDETALVKESNRISFLRDKKQLRITGVKKEDGGKYRCVASNKVNDDVKSNPATLKVEDAGWFLRLCLYITGNSSIDGIPRPIPDKVMVGAVTAVFPTTPERTIWMIEPRQSILVELHCYTTENFLSLVEDFEKGIVKRRLKEEFEKVGCKGELELTITNKEEVYEALGEIRAQMRKREGELPAVTDDPKKQDVAFLTALPEGEDTEGEMSADDPGIQDVASLTPSTAAPDSREELSASWKPVQESDQADSREELSASWKPVQESDQAGFPRDRSHLPQTVPHFVSRERECQSILRWLDPTHECRCILLHGPPGIGKTALAIKVANDRRETDKNTMVVYVNCKYIYSADDFAEKVLAQIYHYPSNNPISGLKTRLVNSDSNKYTIILLDNFEFLIGVDDWIQNQQIEEPVDRIKAADFVERLISSSRNVKLLVTSSQNVVFPTLGKEKITLEAFKPEQTFELLKTVWKTDRTVNKIWADQLSEICSGIPLVLYTLISSQDDLVSRLLHLSSSPPEESFEHLQKIAVVREEDNINVCLDVCFKRLSPQQQNTLVSVTLLKGWFTPSGAAKVFQSTHSSERQLIDQVLELAHCSLLVQNITAQGIGWYTFLSLIREYCKRKEKEQRFSQVFHSARNQCIDYFLNFLKDTFKMFLSRNALQSIVDFQKEEENIMQLLEWLDKDQMDEERIMACIDVFNMVGELLAKMMSKREFKSKYDLLKKKCESKGDEQRLSECLTSLGIKEVFNCCCTPGLCDEASQRAKAYLEEADRIQNDLEITSGNSRAQCLAKLGRCLAQQRDPQGKPKIEEAIRIRLNDHSDEDICTVMLGATYNDMAVALSLEEAHRQAIKIRKEKTLPIYNDKLGEHPFTATIYNNLSNNFCALGEFDQAKPYSEHALKIRRKLLNDHMDTAKSLFDLGMVHKEKGEFEQAITYLEESKNMQEKVLEDNLKDLQRTRQELEDVRTRLNRTGASQPPNVD